MYNNTKPSISARYDNAIHGLDVHIIMERGEMIGRIVTRTRASSGGHTTRAFVHIFGYPMVEGKASGGGYDMRSAALASAIREAMEVWPESIRKLFSPIKTKLESRPIDSCNDPESPVVFVRAV